LSCDFIRGKDTTGTQSLFDTKTSGNLTCLGVGTGILDIQGSGVKFDTLSTNAPTGVQSLFSNKTAGTLNLGSGMTSGTINLLNTGTGSVNVRGKLVVDNIESSSSTTITAPQIRAITTSGGLPIEFTLGTTTTTPSHSFTYNLKQLSTSSSGSNQNVFLFTSFNANPFISNLYELVVSGQNNLVGAYVSKFMFAITAHGTNLVVSNQTTVFNFSPSGFPSAILTFNTPTSTSIIANIQSPNTNGFSYICTLIAYPCSNGLGTIQDLAVTLL
jgi:hypothetical protein